MTHQLTKHQEAGFKISLFLKTFVVFSFLFIRKVLSCEVERQSGGKLREIVSELFLLEINLILNSLTRGIIFHDYNYEMKKKDSAKKANVDVH